MRGPRASSPRTFADEDDDEDDNEAQQELSFANARVNSFLGVLCDLDGRFC